MRKRESLLPKTHENVCKKKRLFMRLLQGNLDPVTRMDYEQAIDHCDKLTRRVSLAALTLIIVLSVGGCGKWMRAGGLVVEGLSVGGCGKWMTRTRVVKRRKIVTDCDGTGHGGPTLERI